MIKSNEFTCMDGSNRTDTRASEGPGTADMALFLQFITQNSEAAFTRLARRYYDLAYRLAFGYCGRCELAEEIAQEAFMKMARERSPQVLERFPSFKIWFSGLVLNTARHVVRTERRVQLRHKNLQAETSRQRESTPERPDPNNDLRGVLSQALSEVSDDLRLPLIMHYVEGMSQEEIGALAGVSQPTVSKRLHKGLGVLRAKLAGMGVAVSALALTDYLRAADCLKTPAIMQAALDNLIRKALAQSVTAHPAGRMAGSAWKPVCIVLLLGATGLATYLVLNAPPAAPEAKTLPEAPATQPLAEMSVLPQVWRFETSAAAREFKPIANPWQWAPATNTAPAGMVAGVNTLAKLPCGVPRQPFKVTLRFAELKDSIDFGCFYLNRDQIMERATWRKRLRLPKQLEHEVVFNCSGRWVVALQHKRPVFIQEYEADYPSADFGVLYGGARLTEVRIEILSTPEASELFTAPEQLIARYGLERIARDAPASP